MLVSFIIPLFGQWKLTHQCLLSLKAHASDCEIILIDNGAHVLDISQNPEERKAKTESLAMYTEFAHFLYLSQEKNLNFAGASNLGAKVAKAPFLFFLNNDTEVQAGFLAPLLEEIQKDSSLKVLAPLLLYPKEGENIHRVQHLGVAFSPVLNTVHLYENFPLNHRVIKRQRNFQALTAAAFLIRKSHFENFYFDEEFINGFEDVELCARIKEKGGVFTVLASSQVIHYCSQSQGRKDKEEHNAKLLYDKTRAREFKGDWLDFLKNDGYILRLDSFLHFTPDLNPKLAHSLQVLVDTKDREKIQKQFLKEPFWQDGLRAIIEDTELSFAEKSVFIIKYLNINNRFLLYFDFAYAKLCNNILINKYSEKLFSRMREGFFDSRNASLLEIPKEVNYDENFELPASFKLIFDSLYKDLEEKIPSASKLNFYLSCLRADRILYQDCKNCVQNTEELKAKIQKMLQNRLF